jgi:hypothetical protein
LKQQYEQVAEQGNTVAFIADCEVAWVLRPVLASKRWERRNPGKGQYVLETCFKLKWGPFMARMEPPSQMCTGICIV